MSIDLDNFNSKLILLSSKNKTNALQNNADFTTSFLNSGGTINNIIGLYIKNFSCPNVFNNVNSYNNKIALQGPSSSHEVLLTENQYTITQLITELTSKIDSAITPNTVTITQNALDKLVFTFSANYSFIYEATTAKNLIGLTADTTSATVNTMQEIVNLTGIQNIYVYSKELNMDGFAEVLNNSSPYGAVSYSSSLSSEMQKLYVPNSKKSFSVIDISLKDEDGNQLYLPDNFYFNMILKIYYE